MSRTVTGETTVRWGRETAYDHTRKRIDGPKGQIASLQRKQAELISKLRLGRIDPVKGMALIQRNETRIQELRRRVEKRLEANAEQHDAAAADYGRRLRVMPTAEPQAPLVFDHDLGALRRRNRLVSLLHSAESECKRLSKRRKTDAVVVRLRIVTLKRDIVRRLLKR